MVRVRERAWEEGTARGRSSPAVFLAALLLAITTGVASRPVLAAEPAASRSERSKVPVIYQKKRSFRIPFHIDEQGRARLKEVQLWVSEDSGYHWDPKSRTTPDMGKFTFRASHDGEFWFATRTLTVDDEYSPPMGQTVEPSMKVFIDTLPPSVVLESDGRRGSYAGVRWEVKDEHLDLGTLALEYQVEGARDWRKVPIQKRALLGAQRWDAGSADSLRVRATVADKAGNVGEAVIDLPEGTAGARDFAAAEVDAQSQPIEPISSRRSPIAAGPGFSPIEDESAPIVRPSRSSSGSRLAFSNSNQGRNAGLGGASPAAPEWQRMGSGMATGGTRAASSMPAGGDPFPAQAPDAGNGNGNGMAGTDTSGRQSMVVASPRFKLQYEIDDAGPNGPAKVELWVTRDGGRTWIRHAEDPDRISPFDVDLGREGTFGINLVARSASGNGDPPPESGDPPQTWVEVDTTPPSVQFSPPQIGTGAYAGKVRISWQASDLHLAPRSVALLWRPDQPGSAWQPLAQGQENSGSYEWSVPPDFPPRFHVRVEATDSVGHQGWSETTEGAPIIVDRSRPRSRIIGLDPNARAGGGPSAPSMR